MPTWKSIQASGVRSEISSYIIGLGEFHAVANFHGLIVENFFICKPY
ncbi:MAG: hypothetical protein ABIQ35_10355 [Verrucomicrobiota bacterium]